MHWCIGVGVVPILLLAKNYKNDSAAEYRMEGQLWADKHVTGGGLMNIEARIGSQDLLLTTKMSS